ncbi:MarR family winged helix-turn-helix transcriptional regulator [Pseudonocardia lacus]|uniref:MarR family winged helix-turn-helix transcriptional regulator n=1 Tax=Pseudonocardia lacus TaxID=2835865 RepID=UPI001BDC3AEF|nr:MarR family transcriptional regulator [Pseudonocardia lacus]
MYMSEDKPIGWWVKQLDRALEEALPRALAGEGVDRRQWQLLNVAAGEGTARALAPFFADPAEADAPVRALAERGWVRTERDRITLTAEGAAARDRLLVAVRAQRERVMAGIAPAEYAATVDVLRRMAANAAAS